MIPKIKDKAKKLLFWLQRYSQIDMLYVASTGFWNTTSFIATSILSVALTFVFANFLPKETYGFYKYIMSLSGALAFLTFSGMNTAVTQAVSNGHDGVLSYAVRFQLKWNLFFTVVSAAISWYYFINTNYVLAISLLILGITFPLLSSLNTYGAFLIGKKDFRRLSFWSVCVATIYNISMIIAIIVFKNIVILVLAYSLSNLLPQIYFYFRTLKVYSPKKSTDQTEKELLKYGAHLSFINVFSNLSQYVDKIVIFHFLGAIQLAVYGLALAIPERIRGYAKTYSSAILPKLSGKNIDDIAPVFYKRSFQAAALGALASLAYIAVAPFAFSILLPKYLESIRYSQVISLSLIIAVPAAYMGSVFESQKMVRTLYLSSTVAHISRIVLFIVLGYFWGIWGVIYASLVLSFLGFFYNMLLWELEIKKHRRLNAPEKYIEDLTAQTPPISD